MDAENSQLEAMLAGYGPRGRTILLEMLHDAQEIYGGWLPRPAIERIAEFLEHPRRRDLRRHRSSTRCSTRSRSAAG